MLLVRDLLQVLNLGISWIYSKNPYPHKIPTVIYAFILMVKWFINLHSVMVYHWAGIKGKQQANQIPIEIKHYFNINVKKLKDVGNN